LSFTRGAITSTAPAAVVTCRGPRAPVAHHQPPALLVLVGGVRGDVSGDLVFERGGQHPPRPLPHDLIQARGQVLAHGLVSDYLQHWRPSRRRWPAGFLPFDHLGRYAAPSIRSRIHNFVSYLRPWLRSHQIRRSVRRA
jgi:hypothetical protein